MAGAKNKGSGSGSGYIKFPIPQVVRHFLPLEDVELLYVAPSFPR